MVGKGDMKELELMGMPDLENPEQPNIAVGR